MLRLYYETRGGGFVSETQQPKKNILQQLFRQRESRI